MTTNGSNGSAVLADAQVYYLAAPASKRGAEVELLTVLELAALWKCSADMIYALIAAGELAATNLGDSRAKTRIWVASATAYIQRQTRTIRPGGAA